MVAASDTEVADDPARAIAGGPRVSVLMPVHNAERYLSEAIESVLGQSFGALELVIIDDGSTDGSPAIAERFAHGDPRVKLLRNPRNLGIVATRNRAFEAADARSEYFAIMDGDDVCLPDRIARQVEFLDSHPEHALVGGNTLIIDEQGRVIGERVYPSEHAQIVKVIARYNPIAQPTVMLRRSALAQVGTYDERYARCQDYDLWLRTAARFKLANLPVFTLKYRISATQGKRVRLRDSLRYTIQIQREWLFRKPFFSPYNLLYHCAEHALLLLPDALVLAAFKRISYRRTPASGNVS
jgi:glycosyltransferase involved in cell wall biosynthesis